MEQKVDPGIFCTSNVGMGDKDIISVLNKKLAKNPTTQLPNGYKRVATKSVSLIYTVPPVVGIQIGFPVLEILDGIVFSAVGVHFLEPYIEMNTTYSAKGVLVKPKGNSALLEEIDKREPAAQLSADARLQL